MIFTFQSLHIIRRDMSRTTIIPLTVSIQCIKLHSPTSARVLCRHFATILAVFVDIAFGDNFRNINSSTQSIVVVMVKFIFLFGLLFLSQIILLQVQVFFFSSQNLTISKKGFLFMLKKVRFKWQTPCPLREGGTATNLK